jgi:hypothetical protein
MEYMQWYFWTFVIGTAGGVSGSVVTFLIIRNWINRQDSTRKLFSNDPEFVVLKQDTMIESINIANSQTSEVQRLILQKLEELNEKQVFTQTEVVYLQEQLTKKKLWN